MQKRQGVLHFALLHILLDYFLFDEFWDTEHRFDQPLHLLIIMLTCFPHPVKQRNIPMNLDHFTFGILCHELGLYTSLNQLHVLDHLSGFLQKLCCHDMLLVLKEYIEENFLGSFGDFAFLMANSCAHQSKIKS